MKFVCQSPFPELTIDACTEDLKTLAPIFASSQVLTYSTLSFQLKTKREQENFKKEIVQTLIHKGFKENKGQLLSDLSVVIRVEQMSSDISLLMVLFSNDKQYRAN